MVAGEGDGGVGAVKPGARPTISSRGRGVTEGATGAQ